MATFISYRNFFLFIAIYLFQPVGVFSQWEKLTSTGGGSPNYMIEYEDGIYISTNEGIYRSSTGLIWENIYTLPNNEGIVFLYKDNDTLYFHGINYPLYCSKNNGVDWEIVTLPGGTCCISDIIATDEWVLLISPIQLMRLNKASGDVEDIGDPILGSFDSGEFERRGDDIWMSLNSGLFKSSDQGKNWEIINSDYMVDALLVIGDTVVVKDMNNGIFRSVDYGNSWDQISTTNFKMQEFYFKENTLYGINKKLYSSAIYASTDLGENWTTFFSGVDAIFGMAKTGSLFNVATGDGVLRSTDNWNTQVFSNTGFYSRFTNSSYFFSAIGDYLISSRQNPSYSNNSGENWFSPFQNNVILRMNDIIWKDDVYYGLYNNGEIFSSVGEIDQWTLHNIGLPLSAAELYLMGDDFIAITYDDEIYRSTDNGLNWQLSGMLPVDLGKVKIAGNKIYAYDNEGLVYSENFGESWTTPAHNGLPAFSFSIFDLYVNNERQYVAKNTGLYQSDDYGENWIDLSSGPQALMVGNTFYPGEILEIEEGLLVFDYDNNVFFSPDFGTTWGFMNEGTNGGDFAKDVVQHGDAVYMVNNKVLWRRDISSISLQKLAGVLFWDNNNNGLMDAGEDGYEGGIVNSSQHNTFFTSDTSGQFYFFAGIIDDTISISVPSPYYTVNPPFYAVNSSNENLTFGIYPEPDKKDLKINQTNITPFRPGFPTELILTIQKDRNNYRRWSS